MLFAALVVPVLAAQKAEAATTDNSCRLNVTADTASNPTGVTHTLTATIGNENAAPCVDASGYEVDFEIESGPAARVNVTGDAGVGGTASDDGNTPLSPDLSCTVPFNTGSDICTVTFTSDTAGAHVLRAWVDDDKNNATFDADATEGQNPGTAVPAGGSADDGATGTGTPGDRTEQDDTDVVSKTWFGTLPANTVLDCSLELATNPNTGAGSAEDYTCQLYNNAGTPGTLTDDTTLALAGVTVDGENNGTANDPDDLAFAGGGNATADYNNFCTTAADGSCTGTVAASEAQAGAVLLCFWADNDGDNVFAIGGTENDGANCDDGNDNTPVTTTPSRVGDANSDRDDITDVTQKTWVGVGIAFAIDLSPDSDQNLKGESHTVTATVTDAFGNPVAGQSVDIDVAGRNDVVAEPSLNGALTGANGQVVFPYTDVNTGTPNGEVDTITGIVDNNGDNAADTNSAGAAMTNTVSKFWFTAAPTAAEVVYDPGADGTDCENTDALTDTEAPTNAVGTRHTFGCASVFNATNQPIPGEVVTFTSAGPGQFHNDADGDGLVDAGELVDTITVTTDVNGDALVTLYSEETGTQTVTATADAQSDSGTKTWTALAARNIGCEPETATNLTGTSHVITCTATDRFGNLTSDAGANDTVTFSESGAGRITSASAPALGADGTVEVIVETTEGEEGTQTITGNLTVDGEVDGPTDLDDVCDQPANDGDAAGVGPADPGAPAGNCEDTVEKVWSDTPIPPVETDHARTAHLNRFKHINLGQGHRSLKVSGTLTTDDGFDACSANQPIKVQMRASGEWITRKSDKTNANGKFRVLVRDIAKKYRAVARKTQLVNDDGSIDNCLRAVSNVRRHRH